jgi:antitoxin component YwqK of YwqJK toxin-antitoxin module
LTKSDTEIDPTKNMKPMTRKFLLAAVLSVGALGLAACGSKVLDYRNAQISNGQIFAGDASEPFNGHITNLPGQKIESSQDGLTRVLQFIRIDNTDSGSLSAALCDGGVEKGYLDGKVTCKDPYSGVTRYQMSFAQGALQGDFTMFAPNGSDPMLEVSFAGGKPDGGEKAYSASTKTLIADIHWTQGVATGKLTQFDEHSGKPILEANADENGKLDGDYVQTTPDGVVFHKLQYSHGQKSGAEDSFDRATGKPTEHTDWQDGKMNGAYKRWDADGNLAQSDTYENGQKVLTPEEQQAASEAAAASAQEAALTQCVKDAEKAYMSDPMHVGATSQQAQQWEATCRQQVSSSQATAAPTSLPSSPAQGGSVGTDTCVSTWLAAYQKEREERGLSEAVSDDQLGEWQNDCKQGKKPG